MGKLTELEVKRQKAQKVLPDLKKLIKTHTFEVVNYAWQKVIEAERKLAKAEAKVKVAQAEADKLKQQLEGEK